MAKIKLKKNKAATQAPGQSTREFVLQEVTPVDSSATLTADEEEVTTLSNLQILMNGLQLDARAFRSGLMRLEENAGDFNALGPDEKEQLAQRFATAFTNIATEVPNFWDRVENAYNAFHPLMVESRKKRFKWCSALIYNSVTPTQAGVIIGKMVTNNLWLLYTEFGVEGTSEGDNTGLYDYVNSTDAFISAGLLEDATGSMIPGTISETELIQRINDCLKLGIFYKG